MVAEFQKGQEVTYRFAGGKVVPGVVMKRHLNVADGHWYVVRLTDEVGTWEGSCHAEQLVAQ